MSTSTSARVPLAITFAVQAASVAAVAAIVVSQLSASNHLVQQRMQRVHTRLMQASNTHARAQVSPTAVPRPGTTGPVVAAVRPADAPLLAVALATTR